MTNAYDYALRELTDIRDLHAGEEIEITFYRKGYHPNMTGMAAAFGKAVDELEGFACSSSSGKDLFQGICVESKTQKQLDAMKKNFEKIGSIIPDATRMRWGLLAINAADIIWLAFLRAYAHKNYPDLITKTKEKTLTVGFMDYEVINKPFFLSLKLLAELVVSEKQSDPLTAQQKENTKRRKIRQALAALAVNAELFNTQLGEEVGLHPSIFSRDKEFLRVAAAIRGSKNDVRSGYLDKNTGNIEAVSDDSNDDDEIDF